MSAEALARTYYGYINDRDVEGVLSILSDDAVFHLPDGREVAGKAALRGMYNHVFSAGGPSPTPVRFVATDTDAAVQVEVKLADGRLLQMASFFKMGADQAFDTVTVYQRGR